MLIMIGASASGKTEIAKILIQQYGFKKMVTYTTRPKRSGEEDGVDYHFLTEGEFLRKRSREEFVETATYNGHYYGTAFSEIRPERVLIVDPKGANAIHEKLNGQAVFFLLETPKSIRAQRMIARGDSLDDIEKRLETDDMHFNRYNLNHIDCVVETGYKTLEELASEIYELYNRHRQN